MAALGPQPTGILDKLVTLE